MTTCFTHFGITLQRLEAVHLEMVRQWRNGPWVRPYMRYRAFIEPPQQIQWFEALDPICDWYFTAVSNDTRFALFHIKDIDWEAKCGEAGGFVGDPRFIGRPEPAQATLALMDFAFHVLQLQSLRARYRVNLSRIVHFNQQLGYIADREEEGFACARVTSERYFACAAPVRRAGLTLHGNTAVLASPDPWLIQHLDGQYVASYPDFQLKVE